MAPVLGIASVFIRSQPDWNLKCISEGFEGSFPCGKLPVAAHGISVIRPEDGTGSEFLSDLLKKQSGQAIHLFSGHVATLDTHLSTYWYDGQLSLEN